MSVRAKFQVVKVSENVRGSKEITLQPQYDKSLEDQSFAKATPSGSIVMLVDNPSAVAYLGLGKYFYVDFEEVPQPSTTQP